MRFNSRSIANFCFQNFGTASKTITLLWPVRALFCICLQRLAMEANLPKHTIYVKNIYEKIGKLGALLVIGPGCAVLLHANRVAYAELKKCLYCLFSQFGKIADVQCCKTNKLRGQAWVIFAEVASATNAVQCMNGFPFFDRKLVRITLAVMLSGFRPDAARCRRRRSNVSACRRYNMRETNLQLSRKQPTGGKVTRNRKQSTNSKQNLPLRQRLKPNQLRQHQPELKCVPTPT